MIVAVNATVVRAVLAIVVAIPQIGARWGGRPRTVNPSDVAWNGSLDVRKATAAQARPVQLSLMDGGNPG